MYSYDPHLDPTLVWAGKAEHTSFEVPTVSLHVHERIDPRRIIEAIQKQDESPQPSQGSLFESKEENPPLRQAIDFYKHRHNWSNRLIAGDSYGTWVEEARKRWTAYKAGRIPTVSYEDVMAKHRPQ